MPTSVRLDPKTEQSLERLSRSKSQTKSEIVRQAIELLASLEKETPFSRAADLIGCVSGGPPDLSEDTGNKFRQLLASRQA